MTQFREAGERPIFLGYKRSPSEVEYKNIMWSGEGEDVYIDCVIALERVINKRSVSMLKRALDYTRMTSELKGLNEADLIHWLNQVLVDMCVQGEFKFFVK